MKHSKAKLPLMDKMYSYVHESLRHNRFSHSRHFGCLHRFRVRDNVIYGAKDATDEEMV